MSNYSENTAKINVFRKALKAELEDMGYAFENWVLDGDQSKGTLSMTNKNGTKVDFTVTCYVPAE